MPLAEILLTLLYTALFIFIIYKWRFFRFEGLKHHELSALFIVKILAGVALTLIYTHYYTQRDEADIFKFFDDSQYIYNALFVNPVHYLQLVFGIDADASHLREYMTESKFWAIQTDEYWQFTGTADHNYFNAHRLVTRFNAIVRLFSFGYYSVHTVFMCFISLTGLMAVYKSFYPFVKDKKWALVIACFLMPSVLLWSSGVLKEGFIFLGVGFLIYAFFKLLDKGFSIKYIFLFVFAAILTAFVKYYLLAALIPAMIAFIIARGRSPLKTIFVYFIFYAFLFGLIALSQWVPALPKPIAILSDKQSELIREAYGGSYCIRNTGKVEEFVYFPPETELIKTITDSSRNIFQVQPGIMAYKYVDGQLTGEKELIGNEENTHTYYWEILGNPTAGSYIEIKKLEPTLSGFLATIPGALVNVFLRPHIFEMKSITVVPAAIENLLILAFFAFALFFVRRFNKENLNMLLFILMSVVTLYLIIGITTPVLGSIVRYKAPLLPLLIIAGLLLLPNLRQRGRKID